ncbi:site-specific DNA-methyltransferase [Bacillus cereus]|nr:site-specific DNA-methyltransferase [Bacillus cereus]
MINKIHNMDCLEGMKLLPDDYVDLTVTSPPYDDLRTYNGYSFDFENIAKELYRVTKQGGIVVWIVGDRTSNGSETGTSFKQALYFKEIGFNLHDTMIYEKDSISFPDSNRYYQIFEYMFIFSKGKPKTTNLISDRANKWADGKKRIMGRERQSDGTLLGRRKGNLLKPYGVRFNIWRVATGKNKSTKDDVAYNHPAIFPEKIANDHIVSWSNEGDIVMDPFMGSGTVAKMAILNNRNYLGFEISEQYCNEIIKPRLEEIEKQLVFL